MIQGKKITVFGGSGFLGRTLLQKLAKKGALISVPVRHPDQAIFLKSMGEVGQITPLAVKWGHRTSIHGAIKGADAVINLIGILYEKGKNNFETVHSQGPKILGEVCQQENMGCLIHISALGANIHSKSSYASSKGRGEQALLNAYSRATILRPSLIFGQDDRFFNRFAALATLSPVLPLFRKGKTRFQPVYVEDVVRAILYSLEHPETQGKIYELGGTKIFTYKELMEIIIASIHRKKILLPLPLWIGKILGAFSQLLPEPPLTMDQIKLLQYDNIVHENALTLKDISIIPQDLEDIVPLYLKRFQPYY